MSKNLEKEIRTWANDSYENGCIENDYEMIKTIIREDHPRISDKVVEDAANLYVSLLWY